VVSERLWVLPTGTCGASGAINSHSPFGGEWFTAATESALKIDLGLAKPLNVAASADWAFT
jgi:hypothetical protein